MKRLLLAITSAIAFSIAPAWAAVNINMATVEQLETIKGIGPKKAAAIVEHRKQHGIFHSVDELANVKGLGPASVERIRHEVTIGNTGKIPAEGGR